MSYTIIYDTKFARISDGRLIRFWRKGCNNDNEGRRKDEYRGKIYTDEELAAYVKELCSGSKPMSESSWADVMIGRKQATLFDVGKYLERKAQKATQLERFLEEHCVYGLVSDGTEVTINGTTKVFTAEEWQREWPGIIYGNDKVMTKHLQHIIAGEKDIIRAVEEKQPVTFYVK